MRPFYLERKPEALTIEEGSSLKSYELSYSPDALIDTESPTIIGLLNEEVVYFLFM